MYDLIVRSRRTARHDLRSIRTCVSGAMRLPPETVEKFQRATGGRLVEGYGLTESSPVALANPLNDNARAGTIGLPVPGTDVRIVNLDDASLEVPFGVAGELCVRGPQVFEGYWGQPDETASMLSDGWLHTGDIAVMDDDGFVTIVDRKRDVILASGFSIFPSEIEDVLAEHPAVAECAVVGIAHFYRGETVKAFLVLREGEKATDGELHDFCAARLVAYKVPTQFEFRTELPRNILGKVLRRVLRAEHEAAHARVVAAERDADVMPTTIIPGAHRDDGASAPHNGLRAELQPNDSPGPPRHGVPQDVDDVNGHVLNGSGALVDTLERLARLHIEGVLTDAEFDAAKARLLH
jgi:long-chain acyl-CoA synthetase